MTRRRRVLLHARPPPPRNSPPPRDPSPLTSPREPVAAVILSTKKDSSYFQVSNVSTPSYIQVSNSGDSYDELDLSPSPSAGPRQFHSRRADAPWFGCQGPEQREQAEHGALGRAEVQRPGSGSWINGRLTMVGFFSAIAVRRCVHARGRRDGTGQAWFTNLVAALSVASLVPQLHGESAEARSKGLMNANPIPGTYASPCLASSRSPSQSTSPAPHSSMLNCVYI
ncbi:hypothetical protein PR202_gb12470 [Eleusine coracana subsp. coracana]|uniref:Uncharacterized protein n=1 Tax=Eleusine coracana subsp. coracana TaxID=191504 RepID=A0AAV5ER27_ELECO|nr:hypothetical protein PR202_gb12470 [Eleusine coracana subsp. coracana]